MKKRLFSYWIAMCILSTNLMAQVPLVKEGATWYYGFHLKGEDNYGYVKMTYLGDSFVQNALHHRIKEEEYTYDPIMDDVVKTDDDLLFVDLIFIKFSSSSHILRSTLFSYLML